jgi:hypothetical protein
MGWWDPGNSTGQNTARPQTATTNKIGLRSAGRDSDFSEWRPLVAQRTPARPAVGPIEGSLAALRPGYRLLGRDSQLADSSMRRVSLPLLPTPALAETGWSFAKEDATCREQRN